jgi:hypothetical protein
MSDLRTVNGDDRCGTCSQTFQWHQDNQPRHPFNTGQEGAKDFLNPRRDRDTRNRGNVAQRDAESPPHVVWPTDPVLRIALINAGVITPDHLRMAEDMLRSSMGLGGPDGESTEEARRGEIRLRTATPVDVGKRPERG